VNEQEAGLMKAAISDKALVSVSPEIRDETRAAILKNMLMSLTI
jgi:transcriptional regulator CtsR